MSLIFCFCLFYVCPFPFLGGGATSRHGCDYLQRRSGWSSWYINFILAIVGLYFVDFGEDVFCPGNICRLSCFSGERGCKTFMFCRGSYWSDLSGGRHLTGEGQADVFWFRQRKKFVWPKRLIFFLPVRGLRGWSWWILALGKSWYFFCLDGRLERFCSIRECNLFWWTRLCFLPQAENLIIWGREQVFLLERGREVSWPGREADDLRRGCKFWPCWRQNGYDFGISRHFGQWRGGEEGWRYSLLQIVLNFMPKERWCMGTKGGLIFVNLLNNTFMEGTWINREADFFVRDAARGDTDSFWCRGRLTT